MPSDQTRAGCLVRAADPAIPAGTLSVCLPLAPRSRPGRRYPPGDLSQGLARLVIRRRRWEPARLALPHRGQHDQGPVPQAATAVDLLTAAVREPRYESHRCTSHDRAFAPRYPRAGGGHHCTICRNTTVRSCSSAGPTRIARSRVRCTCPCRPPGCAFFAPGRPFKCITWSEPRAPPHPEAAHEHKGRVACLMNASHPDLSRLWLAAHDPALAMSLGTTEQRRNPHDCAPGGSTTPDPRPGVFRRTEAPDPRVARAALEQVGRKRASPGPPGTAGRSEAHRAPARITHRR